MDTIDKVQFPPGPFIFAISAVLGTGLPAESFLPVIFIDPCPDTLLTITQPNPLEGQEYSYYLRDADLAIEFDPNTFLERETPVSCGAATVDFFDALTGDPLDDDIFSLDYSELPFKLKVKQTPSLSVTGEYTLGFRMYYPEFDANQVEATDVVTIFIIDPCERPVSLDSPSSLTTSFVQEYTISTAQVTFTFDPFISVPAWCDQFLVFEVENDQVLPVITDFSGETRTFSFEYSADLAPLNGDALLSSQDFVITVKSTTGIIDQIESQASFILKVKNPCDASNGVPETETPDFCPVEPGDFYDPNMPSWMRLI